MNWCVWAGRLERVGEVVSSGIGLSRAEEGETRNSFFLLAQGVARGVSLPLILYFQTTFPLFLMMKLYSKMNQPILTGQRMVATVVDYM